MCSPIFPDSDSPAEEVSPAEQLGTRRVSAADLREAHHAQPLATSKGLLVRHVFPQPTGKRPHYNFKPLWENGHAIIIKMYWSPFKRFHQHSRMDSAWGKLPQQLVPSEWTCSCIRQHTDRSVAAAKGHCGPGVVHHHVPQRNALRQLRRHARLQVPVRPAAAAGKVVWRCSYRPVQLVLDGTPARLQNRITNGPGSAPTRVLNGLP